MQLAARLMSGSYSGVVLCVASRSIDICIDIRQSFWLDLSLAIVAAVPAMLLAWSAPIT